MPWQALVNASTCSLVKSLDEKKNNKQTFRSISNKYTKDLEALLKTLGEANLHYIRCIKPNTVQKPDLFNAQLVILFLRVLLCCQTHVVKQHPTAAWRLRHAQPAEQRS